jgi:hypothetical protein
MLELLIVIGRALALALRGHRELVRENLALRQQLTAVTRTTTRPHLQTRDRLFWIAFGSSLAELAHGAGVRATGHGRAVASRLAPPPMDPTVDTPTERPSTDRSVDPRPRPRDGGYEPVVRSPADSWRAAHPRCRRLRTHRVASAGRPRTSAVANLEDIPHESPRVSRVDRFLHRADAHRPGAVRPGVAVASPPAHRARQHHGSSDGHLVRATSSRRISGRHGAPLVAPRSRPHLR